MPRCCPENSRLKVEEGRFVEVTGTGTAQDPLVVSSDVSLATEDNKVFDIGLSGVGTLASPWLLRVRFADTAELTDLPDVDADDRVSGNTLVWNDAAGKWIASAVPVVDNGVVLTGDGLDGDGSPGVELQVVGNLARFIDVTTDGVGLSDAGVNKLIRVFDDAAARSAASPPLVEGSFTLLKTDPTALYYYTGGEHARITGGLGIDAEPGGEFLAVSGPYTGGQVTRYLRQLEAVTDSTGAFVVVPAEDLEDYAGVLSVTVQAVGLGPPWTCNVQASGSVVGGIAYQPDGTPYTGATIEALVSADLY